MFSRRRTPPAVFGFVACCFAATFGIAAPLPGFASTAQSADQFLISFGQRAVRELNDETLSDAAREQRFRELFEEAVDLPAIAKFILGIHWRQASRQERADFLAVFEDIALQRFLPIFTRQSDEYAGKSFDVVEVRRDKNNSELVFVSVRVAREQGEPIRLVWRLRERNDQYKILDITAAGLSMALTLRQEYRSAIKQAGSVAGLVTKLRQKVKAGAFAPKAANNAP